MELFFNNLLGLFLVLNFITASNAQSLKKSKVSKYTPITPNKILNHFTKD